MGSQYVSPCPLSSSQPSSRPCRQQLSLNHHPPLPPAPLQYLFACLVPLGITIVASTFLLAPSAKALERVGLLRDLQRVAIYSSPFWAAGFLVIALVDWGVLPSVEGWETIVTWCWLMVYAMCFIHLHLSPSRVHGFGPRLFASRRISPINPERERAAVLDHLLALKNELGSNSPSAVARRRDMAKRHVFSTSASSTVATQVVVVGGSWASSTSGSSAADSPASRAAAWEDTVMSMVSDLTAVPLEKILDSAHHRSLLKAFARSLLSEHLIDFLILLRPYHLLPPDPTTNPQAEEEEGTTPASSSARTSPSTLSISPEELTDIYSIYIRGGATFQVPISSALYHSLQGICEPRRRRSLPSSLPGDPPGNRISNPENEIDALRKAYREVAEVVERDVLGMVRWMAFQDHTRRPSDDLLGSYTQEEEIANAANVIYF